MAENHLSPHPDLQPSPEENAQLVWQYLTLSAQIVNLELELLPPDPTRFLVPLKVLNPGDANQQIISFHTEKRSIFAGEEPTNVFLSRKETWLLLSLYTSNEPVSGLRLAEDWSKFKGETPIPNHRPSISSIEVIFCHKA